MTLMRRPLFGVLLTALGGAVMPAQAQTPPLQRIVEKPLAVHRPARECGSEAPRAVMRLGEAAGVLTGAERFPGTCNSVPLPHEEIVQLQGLTVEAALTRIVEIDPRFEWRERNGVIVLRPVEAWSASDNPLNNEIGSFATRDRNSSGALDTFIANERIATKPDYEDKAELLRQKFNVQSTKRPAIDALDEIIRAHGAMNWVASYIKRPASRESLRVSMFPFDGDGAPAQPRDRISSPEEDPVDRSPFERIVDTDFELSLPVHACSVPTMVGLIAKRHRVPAGIEFPTEACPASQARGATRPASVVSLGGLTVREALNKLVEADRRFRWVESNGLALVRPVAAWGDEKNVLNFTSTAFEVKDANLDQAMSAVVSALQSRPRDAVGDGVRSNQGSKLLSVKTGPTSVGEALDAIIRAHGEGWWEVQPFRGSPAMRLLGFHTFDGSYIRSLIPSFPR
jgi:hypothetical protein